MKRKRKYEIERPQPGVLTCREGGTEFRFPVYDEDGEVVFVAWPTSQRIFLYFLMGGWTRVPRQFSKRDRERITAHVMEHFQRDGARVRVLTRAETEEEGLQFRPELFECKSRASGILDTAGFVWFSDYSSIDLLHEEFGLEVCGIHEEASVEPIAAAMRSVFLIGIIAMFATRIAVVSRDGNSRCTCFRDVAEVVVTKIFNRC